MDHHQLAGEAGERQVLAIDASDKDIVVAQVLSQVVQAGVGILLDAAEGGQIVLEPVIVAVAEQPDAQLIVLKQKPTEFGGERLNADAQAIEVIALRDIAQVIVDEGFLDPDKRIVAAGFAAGLDIEDALFRHVDIIVLERQGDPELNLRRHESGRALDHRSRRDERLGQHQAGVPPKDIQAARP